MVSWSVAQRKQFLDPTTRLLTRLWSLITSRSKVALFEPHPQRPFLLAVILGQIFSYDFHTLCQVVSSIKVKPNFKIHSGNKINADKIIEYLNMYLVVDKKLMIVRWASYEFHIYFTHPNLLIESMNMVTFTAVSKQNINHFIDNK